MKDLNNNCQHNVHQVHTHAFECIRCRAIFLGFAKDNPIVNDYISNNYVNKINVSQWGNSTRNIEPLHQEVVHDNLEPLLEVLEQMYMLKGKITEIEKTLPILVDILKEVTSK